MHDEDYLRVLNLVDDNIEGPKAAFSIQNVARMGLAFDKFPGEWYGPSLIC